MRGAAVWGPGSRGSRWAGLASIQQLLPRSAEVRTGSRVARSSDTEIRTLMSICALVLKKCRMNTAKCLEPDLALCQQFALLWCVYDEVVTPIHRIGVLAAQSG